MVTTSAIRIELTDPLDLWVWNGVLLYPADPMKGDAHWLMVAEVDGVVRPSEDVLVKVGSIHVIDLEGVIRVEKVNVKTVSYVVHCDTWKSSLR